MSQKIMPASSFGVTQVAIFDDIHEVVQQKINELFSELGIKTSEICFEQYEHRVDKNGKGCTYAVIRYQQKNPAD